ncbi:MAG: cobalamin B12-binding domain-containing protein [Candidatus Lokiarchaeota archaeon]|nr:cobalamin B12-binding domain-containing protein [Candidatus Lokiarchaeota archaeon]
MKNYDIIFIHPPRVLNPDYGKNTKFNRGTFIFIPMGVFAIADFLEKEGFGVKIINYPLEQYLNRNWNLSDFLKNIDFGICGIDLHWIHNAHGAIEVAKIVKKINPNAKVVLGGYSASYYHYQILKYYKNVDAIIRGDGEVPFLKFVQKINQNQPLDSVPNLSYRDSDNNIKVNPISYVAKNLDNLNFTNISLLNNAKQYFESSRKIMGISFNLPIGRGCPFNCPFCAGGQRAQLKISGRNNVILRNPEKVIEDINIILNKFKIPSVFFGHGTYPANFKYWKNLFWLIQKENIDIGGDLEIWRLPFPKEMWKIFYKTFTRRYSSISISPRTMSARVHQKITEICDPTFRFPKTQINDLIKNANLFRMTLRIWLTVGFPFQTRIDVLKDFNFGLKCVLKYGKSNFKPITVMNEPYYIFPGSPVHEAPKKFGINLKFNSFPEVVEVFKRAKISHFYNVINYDTKNFYGNSIRIANMLLLLSTAPTLLTTGSKYPKMR